MRNRNCNSISQIKREGGGSERKECDKRNRGEDRRGKQEE